MLSDEQKTVLSDIETLLEQIKTLETGDEQNVSDADLEVQNQESETEDEERAVEMTMDEENEIIEKASNIIKSRQAQKSAEGTNVNDQAEERLMDDLPEQTQENVSEVAKSVKAMNKTLTEITRVIKSLSSRTTENQTAIENLLGGINLTEKVLKSYDQSVVKQLPVTETNRDRVLKDLISKRVEKDDSSQEPTSVKEAMTAIFGA
jgi:hypothetical protein